MLLGASSTRENAHYDVNSVTSEHLDSGVPHGAWIRQLTEATIRGDWLTLSELRVAAKQDMSEQNIVDVFVVAAAFNGITRVADATGIPLDENTAQVTSDMRASTGIEEFAYATKSTRYG